MALIMIGASVLSRIGIGSLTDVFSPWIIALLTNLFTSLSIFVLWGVLSRNFAGVLAFGITYGALAGGWASIFPGFAKPLASKFEGSYRIHSSLMSTCSFAL